MNTPLFAPHRKIGLDLPRAVAILLVLLAHCAKCIEITGFYGVELFFALSGFLIGGILYRDVCSSPGWTISQASRFCRRRWWRTLPNYYLFLCVFVVFSYFQWGLPPFGKFLRYFVFTQNLSCGNSSFYGVSWSLCIEEWFYVLFPLSLLILVNLGLTKRRAFVVVTVFFLAGPALLREKLFTVCAPEDVRMMTFARLDAIFYGVAAAFAVHRFKFAPSARFLAFLTGLGLVLGVVLVRAVRPSIDAVAFYRIAFWIVPGGFALTLPLLETIEKFPARLNLVAGAVEKLSLWSYSMYLCHIPILFSVYAAFGAIRNNAVVNTASKAVAMLIVLIVSKFLFELFEKPLLRFRPRASAGEVA